MKTRHFFTKALIGLLLAIAIPNISCASDEINNTLPEALLQQTSQSKDTKKNARAEDPADAYFLRPNGDFFRIVGGRNSRIDSHVEDFKISQHPEDVAFVYYIQNGNLKIIGQSGKPHLLCSRIKKENGRYKYHVVPSTHTTIVNTVLTDLSEFIAWDNKVSVYEAKAIRDYRLNPCFGTGRPFSSYVAFLIDYRGYITKVRGKNPSTSKTDYSRTYSSLKEFIEVNDIH